MYGKWFGAHFLLKIKSIIFAFPYEVIAIFYGFKFLWIIELKCKKFKPYNIFLKIFFIVYKLIKYELF